MPGWTNQSATTFNWNILTSQISSTDSLSINFTVVADDEHGIRAIDDQSSWRSKDTVFTEP